MPMTRESDSRQPSPDINILLSDTQLAGEGSGFVLAQWVRRHRPNIETILTGSIVGKTQAVCDILARIPGCTPQSDAATLTVNLNGMLTRAQTPLTSATQGRANEA